MVKISALPPNSSPAADDVVPGVDDSTSSTVKWTLATIAKYMYPVGSVYINSSDSTNPATLLGFGTWAAFGAGRVPVGFDSGDTDFDTAEETGGLKQTNHAFPLIGINTSAMQDMGQNYQTSVKGDVQTYIQAGGGSALTDSTATRAVGGTVRTNGTANIEVHHGRYTSSNLQPYITVYMWKRTA